MPLHRLRSEPPAGKAGDSEFEAVGHDLIMTGFLVPESC
jgi:hypothetical protein